MVEYLPVLIFAVVAALFPVVGRLASAFMQWLTGVRKPEVVKLQAY